MWGFLNDQYYAERALAWLYSLIALFSGLTVVSFMVAWQHWKYVLDVCVETNCGCILFGESTPIYFTGGHVAFCHWAALGPLVTILVAVIFGSFHVYRVCCNIAQRNRQVAHTVKQRSGEVIVMTTRTEEIPDDISPYYWIPASVAAIIMFLYTLVHASMYTAGFLETCKQYRYALIKQLNAGGPPFVALVQGRLMCATIYDFMDYFHQDVSYERRREGRINTPVALVLPFIGTWVCVGLWLAVAVICLRRVNATRSVRV